MDPVHDKGVHGPGPYFDGPGPWTGSTEGVHGPGVHVLYFPVGGRALEKIPSMGEVWIFSGITQSLLYKTENE